MMLVAAEGEVGAKKKEGGMRSSSAKSDKEYGKRNGLEVEGDKARDYDVDAGICVTETTVRINGKALVCLWDTGATRTVMSEEAAKRLGVESELTGNLLKINFAVRGMARVEEERVATATLQIVGREGKIHFTTRILVSKCLDRFDMVIGKDVLNRLSRENGMQFIVHQNMFVFEQDNGRKLRVQATIGNMDDIGFGMFATELTTTSEASRESAQSVGPSAPTVKKDMDLVQREAKLREEYEEVFAETGQLGQLPATLDIELVDKLPPKRIPRGFDFSPPQEQFLDERMRELERSGAIREVRFDEVDYISPFFLVQKQRRNSGDPIKWREVIDLRKLNLVTKRETLAAPRMEAILQRLCQSSLFSVVDVRTAFHMVPVEARAQRYLGFRDHRNRLWTWTRAPFGRPTAPRHSGEAWRRRSSG